MGMKDFDLKGFLLHKGEKVGLAVAGGLTVLLVGFGIVTAARSGSPTTTAGEIDSLRKSTKDKIDRSSPSGSQPVVDPAQLAAVLTFERIDPSRFPLDVPFLISGSAEDMKRRSPEVLAPSEFHMELVRGAVLGHNLTVGRDGRISVQILLDKQFSTSQNRNMNSRVGRMLGRGGAGAGGMMPGGGGGDDSPGGGGPGGGFPGMGGGFPGMGGGGRMPGGDMGGGGAMPGMMGGMMGDLGSRKVYSEKWVDHKELERLGDAKLAEALYPVRMVIVSGSFPYKEQWEEFRRKLRRRTLAETLAMGESAPFEFSGFEIQRQVYGPDGKPQGDWTDFTKVMEDQIKRLFIRASAFEQEDDKLMQYQDYGILNERIVLPRPMMAKQQKYPKEELKELDEAIASLDKLSKDTTPPPLSDRQRKLSGDFDIFNPLSGGQELQGMGGEGPGGTAGMTGERGPGGGKGGGGRGGMMPGGIGMGSPGGVGAGGLGMGPGGAGMGPGGVGTRMPGGGMMPGGMRPGGRPGGEDGPGGAGLYDQLNQEPVLADKCLVRFIDPTVQPGHSYEYRIRIKMTNPNYQKPEEWLAYKSLAKDKEIVAKEWTPIGQRITVPPDLTYYVVDERPEKGPRPAPADQNLIAFQIHRWLESVVTNPTASQLKVAVGDWSIWERVLLHRGDYIGKPWEMKVPTWEYSIEDYILARNTSTKPAKNLVPVDFTSRQSLSSPPALLVDFQQGGPVSVTVGGKSVRDEFVWQALILTPDGKLVLRNGRDDTEDKERQERLKEHREWVKQVESGRRTNGGQFNNSFDRLNPGAPGMGPGGRGSGGS